MRAYRLITALLGGSLGVVTLAASAAPASDPAALTTSPDPPVPPSPVAVFRELLQASPEQQGRALAERPETQRRALAAKLREYAALSPAERELRLQATELRYYLRPLLTEGAPPHRAEQLRLVPAHLQALVAERLQQWDGLPPAARQEILNHDWAVHYFLQVRPPTVSPPPPLPSNVPRAGQEKLERELSRWQALPPERRQRICQQFQRFFDLAPAEKRKTLQTLPEQERLELEQTIRLFEQLPAAQRDRCLDSFRQLAQLPPAEQRQFTSTADRWKAMSAADRAGWRQLVTLLPPLPPPLQASLAAGPPLPPEATPATN
jgi:hypothetical protein